MKPEPVEQTTAKEINTNDSSQHIKISWREAIEHAQLPSEVAALITRVVRRTRLWPREKTDLACELITHFVDGLAAGQSKEQLMNDFGDPIHAGRLIGKAKKRNRHWVHRGFVYSCQGLLVLLMAAAVGYGVLAWRFYHGEPNITRNFAAEYNKTIEEIPQEDRAWDLYVQAYVMMDLVPADVLEVWPAPSPEQPKIYNAAIAYLQNQQDVLALIRKAAAKPHLGAKLTDAIDPRIVEASNRKHPNEHQEMTTPSENPILIRISMPEMSYMRDFARLLSFDAIVAADKGDADRAYNDLIALTGMANQMGERPAVIGSLLSIAIEQLSLYTTGQIMHLHPELLSNDQLQRLSHTHGAYMGGKPHVNLTAERWFFEDTVQRLYSDDGNGNGHITASGIHQFEEMMGMINFRLNKSSPITLAPLMTSFIADRKEMMAKYNELMDKTDLDAALPMWEYDHRRKVEDEIAQLNSTLVSRLRYFPLVILMPALGSSANAAEQEIQIRDAVLTGIALELYKREHGDFPESLEALVPKYVPRVYPDRFTGKPLHYAVVDGQAKLWSVGVDRNDDGGHMPVKSKPFRGNEMRWKPAQQAAAREKTDPDNYDGDWILWPIEYIPNVRSEPAAEK